MDLMPTRSLIKLMRGFHSPGHRASWVRTLEAIEALPCTEPRKVPKWGKLV
jgi:hypothetical protein